MNTLKIHTMPRRVRTMLLMTLLLIGLLIIHSLIRGNVIDYTYLLWNFVLAAVPALMIYAWQPAQRRRFHVVSSVAIILIWLAFLPNTFYLLTEFTHLNPSVLVNLPADHTTGSIAYGRGSALYVFDSLLMLIATIFGAYTGGMALLDGFYVARRLTNISTARILMTLVILLVSIGAYLGRYGRWNSWDIVVQPGHVGAEFWHQLSRADTLERFLIFTCAILLFELISLYAILKLNLTDTTSQ